MNQFLVTVDILSVLQFFDGDAPGVNRHVAAVTATAGEDLGAGLIVDYFHRRGIEAEVLKKKKENAPKNVTTGTGKGHWLDRWIHVCCNGKHIYYQTEIKNWSAHSMKGKCIPVDVSPDELAKHKIERWKNVWKGTTFRGKGVRKVLDYMEPPKPKSKVRPMICFWDAMHPNGADEPLFSHKVEADYFDRVWVFSMSAYLRQLLSEGTQVIQLEMMDTANRLEWIGKMFPST
ncbi:MAG: hypothetical protein WCF84_24290 [Anaerolineae bacterium]